jgi:hypothetical protein
MGDGRVVPTRESAELLGELARELSALVRRDIEVAAVERLTVLRRAFLDLAAVLVVVLAAVFALAALTIAAGVAVAAVVPDWSAVLVVAAVWALVAAVMALVLVRPQAQPREREELVGLLQLVSRKHRLEELRSSREEARDRADQEVRETSAALVGALLEEAAEHQAKALPGVATQEVASAAEAAAPDVLSDALAFLMAPARAGLTVLGRLVEPSGVERESEQRSKARPEG